MVSGAITGIVLNRLLWESLAEIEASNQYIAKNHPISIGGFFGICTPKATLVERSQLEIEQFLAMLQFENRKKLEELPGILK